MTLPLISRRSTRSYLLTAVKCNTDILFDEPLQVHRETILITRANADARFKLSFYNSSKSRELVAIVEKPHDARNRLWTVKQ
jgi:hypothetical protein